MAGACGNLAGDIHEGGLIRVNCEPEGCRLGRTDGCEEGKQQDGCADERLAAHNLEEGDHEIHHLRKELSRLSREMVVVHARCTSSCRS